MNKVCKRAGVARSTPTRWQNGETEPRTSKMRALEGALAQLIVEKRRGKKAA